MLLTTCKDVMELFYVQNDDMIQQWSKEKRLILEYNAWLEKNFKVPLEGKFQITNN